MEIYTCPEDILYNFCFDSWEAVDASRFRSRWFANISQTCILINNYHWLHLSFWDIFINSSIQNYPHLAFCCDRKRGKVSKFFKTSNFNKNSDYTDQHVDQKCQYSDRIKHSLVSKVSLTFSSSGNELGYFEFILLTRSVHIIQILFVQKKKLVEYK